jgi:hypothetical protein
MANQSYQAGNDDLISMSYELRSFIGGAKRPQLTAYDLVQARV